MLQLQLSTPYCTTETVHSYVTTETVHLYDALNVKKLLTQQMHLEAR